MDKHDEFEPGGKGQLAIMVGEIRALKAEATRLPDGAETIAIEQQGLRADIAALRAVVDDCHAGLRATFAVVNGLAQQLLPPTEPDDFVPEPDAKSNGEEPSPSGHSTPGNPTPDLATVAVAAMVGAAIADSDKADPTAPGYDSASSSGDDGSSGGGGSSSDF